MRTDLGARVGAAGVEVKRRPDLRCAGCGRLGGFPPLPRWAPGAWVGLTLAAPAVLGRFVAADRRRLDRAVIGEVISFQNWCNEQGKWALRGIGRPRFGASPAVMPRNEPGHHSELGGA